MTKAFLGCVEKESPEISGLLVSRKLDVTNDLPEFK